MTNKERLHALVEDLPENEIHAALRFLEYLRDLERDPLMKNLREASPDDEPVTEEDLAALAEAWEDVKQGRVVSHEEVRRRSLGEP